MDRKRVGVGLVVIGLVLSLLGTLGHDWLVHEASAAHVGLRELEVCATARCHQVALAEARLGDAFTMAGNVAFFAPLIAGALAVVASVLALNRAPVRGPISPARLAAGFYVGAAVAAIVFLAKGPAGVEGLDVGWSAFVGIAGAIIAGAGATTLAIEERRAARPLAEPPAPLPTARAVPPDARR
jgi:hypothetical protein